MNTISKVCIYKLWNEYNLTINFNEKINYIIGANGSGKTSVINLIASAINADISKLEKIDFEKIEITFKKDGDQKRPKLIVTKINKKFKIIDEIVYSIIKSSKSAGEEVIATVDASDRLYNGRRSISPRYRQQDVILNIKRKVDDLVKMSWLPVQRYDEFSVDKNEDMDYVKRIDSTIDRKLFSLSNELVRFFSFLSQRYSEYAVDFQKSSFLSILKQDKLNSVFEFAQGLDVENEKKSIVAIFDVLGIEKRVSEPLINNHFKKLTKLQLDRKNKSQNSHNSIKMNEFSTFYTAWKISSLVDGYKILQEEKHKIFKQRDAFLEILNDLFENRKTFSISDNNELVIKTQRDQEILLTDLSSGEKQILIILSEALLQNLEPVVYIADEPELSLHISWQEKLSKSILLINPRAQIIFATHSPDIIGQYQGNVLDMEGFFNE